jgi:hypothetical protein
VHDQVLSPAGDGLKQTSQEENFTFQITEIVQKEKVTFFPKKSYRKITLHTILIIKAIWEH